jgi:hypothetical protein
MPEGRRAVSPTTPSSIVIFGRAARIQTPRIVLRFPYPAQRAPLHSEADSVGKLSPLSRKRQLRKKNPKLPCRTARLSARATRLLGDDRPSGAGRNFDEPIAQEMLSEGPTMGIASARVDAEQHPLPRTFILKVAKSNFRSRGTRKKRRRPAGAVNLSARAFL